MFNVNTSSIATAFAEYREENNFLITKFKRVAELLKRFKQYEHLEKNDVAKRGFFESSNDIVDLLKSLDLNVNDFIKYVDDMIKSLEKEKSEMDKYFGKVKNTTIESISHLERELIAFNHTQSDLMEKIKTYVPNVVNLTDRVIAMEDETYEKQAVKYAKMFEKLKESLEKQVDKSHVFEALEEIILYAGSASRDLLRYLEQNPNALKFLDNLIVRGIHFKRDLEGWMKKIGRDKNKDTTYSNLGDHEEKLDKFMKSTLEALFNGIELEDDGADVAAKKVIGKIIKAKTDFKELEKEFKENYDAVSNLLASLKYVSTSNRRKYILSLDEISYNFTDDENRAKRMTFKKFKKDFLKDDKDKIPVIEAAIRDLANLSDKKVLEEFLKNDPSVEKAGGSSTENILEVFVSGEKFEGDSSDIGNFIGAAIDEVLGASGLGGIITVLGTIDADTELDGEVLAPFKGYIIEHLRTIGRNLSLYREKEKTSWSNDVYDRLITRIKDLIDGWNGDITNKVTINQLINDTEHTLNSLR